MDATASLSSACCVTDRSQKNGGVIYLVLPRDLSTHSLSFSFLSLPLECVKAPNVFKLYCDRVPGLAF